MLGTNNIYKYEFVHGPELFWEKLNAVPDFFLTMETMPGAFCLLDRTKHYRQRILTALPKTNGENVDRQKRRWVLDHIGSVPVITCLTHEKPNFAEPGDILIDDRAVNRKRWEEAGGRYILHTSATNTLQQLDEMLS